MKNNFFTKYLSFLLLLIGLVFLGASDLVKAQSTLDTDYCTKIETNVTFSQPIVVRCDAGYHVEGTTCVANNSQIPNWYGNTFNGYYSTLGIPTAPPPGLSCDQSTGSATFAADNCFKAYLNGTEIGRSDGFPASNIEIVNASGVLYNVGPEACNVAWYTPYTYNNLNYIIGQNVIAVEATDYGWPYGVAAQFTCGANDFFTSSDKINWKCSSPQDRGTADPIDATGKNWYDPGFNDSFWITPSSVSASFWDNYARATEIVLGLPVGSISVPIAFADRIWSSYGSGTGVNFFNQENKKIFCRVSFQRSAPPPPVDNCPGIDNPDQLDSDGDGIGDLCDDCYEYPAGSGNCVTLTATQGANTYTFKPYAVNKSASAFYGYDVIPNSASIAEYPIVKSNRSEIFGYIEADGSDAPMMSLGFIHDIPDDGSGGSASFSFSGIGWDMATVSVADEPSQLVKTQTPPGDWDWAGCCTDGGMLDMAPLDTSWSITITPSNWDGINSWFLKEPGFAGVEQGTQLANLTDPVTISYSYFNGTFPVTFKYTDCGITTAGNEFFDFWVDGISVGTYDIDTAVGITVPLSPGEHTIRTNLISRTSTAGTCFSACRWVDPHLNWNDPPVITCSPSNPGCGLGAGACTAKNIDDWWEKIIIVQ